MRLLVLRSARVDRGRLRFRFRLAARPNDRAGWTLAGHPRVTRTPWRIVISMRTPTLTVRRSGRVARRMSVVRPVDAAGYSPSASGSAKGPVCAARGRCTSPRTRVLDDYGGGEGRVAIHGRTGDCSPTRWARRGRTAASGSTTPPSHGSPAAIEGTPVLITN